MSIKVKISMVWVQEEYEVKIKWYKSNEVFIEL